MLVTACVPYSTYIYDYPSEKWSRNTRYDTCENIPFALVTFLFRSPFGPALRLFREKWNMSEPLEIPAWNSILRATQRGEF